MHSNCSLSCQAPHQLWAAQAPPLSPAPGLVAVLQILDRGVEGGLERERGREGGKGGQAPRGSGFGAHPCRTLTCIHAVVHLVVTGFSIFTQVARGRGF